MAACSHPGFRNEGRELIDRDFEFADRKSFRDDDASRTSFDLLVAVLALGRAHHELSSGQRDHLRAILTILEAGALRPCGGVLDNADMPWIRYLGRPPQQISCWPCGTKENSCCSHGP